MVVQCEGVVWASKAKYRERPIAKKYREGRMKRTGWDERQKVHGKKPTRGTRIETRTKEITSAARRRATPGSARDRRVAVVRPER